MSRNCCGRGQPAECLNGDLIGPPVQRSRRLIQNTGGDLQVLARSAASTSNAVEIVRAANLFGFEPYTHGVLRPT